ncbi:MAG: patatin-like phospholipase family protein [Acidimicrobiales bacterium]
MKMAPVAPEATVKHPSDPLAAGAPAVDAAQLPGGVFLTSGAPRRWLARRRTGTSRRRARTAFVFAGGSSRGAAQIGMVQALVARDITPDAVFGTSVGAVNAAGFCSDPTASGVERMASIWRRLTADDIFPQGRMPNALRYFQQRESVHPNRGLRRVIEEGITFDRLEHAAAHLEVVATSLYDGRTRWFTSGPAVERILASAALPALLPPVEIDGEPFIDGGVVDNVPIGRAMSQGAERIFVLLCGPMHYTPHRYRRPVEAVLTAFFIAVHTRFVRELAHLPEGVEVVVFTIDSEPVSRYDDFSNTETLIEAGRVNADTVLDFWQAGCVGDRFTPASAARRMALAGTRPRD